MRLTHRTQRSRRAAIGVAVAALALTLSACSPTGGSTQPNPTEQHADMGVSIVASDAWAKATDADIVPGEGMTGVFAELENHGDEDLVITGVSSDAAAHVELHEVVDGQMRAVQADVVVPAGGSLTLEPGANHIMLMELAGALLPGDEVIVTVEFSDGTSLDITALVKDTSGANESYGDLEHGDGESGDNGDHAH